MILNGFGFSSYRSFGNELVKIAPLKKINFIIGQNNVGKSNIVTFLSNKYSNLLNTVKGTSDQDSSLKIIYNTLDKPLTSPTPIYKISFPLLDNQIEKHIEDVFLKNKIHRTTRENIKENIKKIFLSPLFSDGNGITWFTYKFDDTLGKRFSFDIDYKKIRELLYDDEWHKLWQSLTNSSGGSIENDWIPETIKRIFYIPNTSPSIELIPAIRKIGVAHSEAKDYSGEGIIDRIAKIQNPSMTEQKLKKKFDLINSFIQKVLDNQDAKIEIPFKRDMIIVHMNEKTLPLESLGTGIHEVIILAAASTILDNSILCVEEPELHIHPILQRKLINYLSENTNNQYFFTTHSTHLLDAADASIFHITLKNNESKINNISSTKQRSEICHDLGYKASDILQSNCIIWVEGPSDRIYINNWLHNKRLDFIEGIHYSIMFYGGRLSSHISGLDIDEYQNNYEDLISVRNLNRNSILIIDSDKSSETDNLNATKERLIKEFNNGPGFTWVTEGREIENYINYSDLEKCILAIHNNAIRIKNKSQWSPLLKYISKIDNNIHIANKVKAARYYVDNFKPNYNILDLEEQIEKIIGFITLANN